MIISHKHRFIFIEVPKTASSSIANFLQEYLPKNNIECERHEIISGSDWVFTRKKTDTYPHCHRHCDLLSVLKDFPNASKYFKFCFVRNPWDRVISWFFYKKGQLKNPKRKQSFNEFLKEIQLSPQIEIMNHTPQNFDFIGRFENLQNDFETICDKIDINFHHLPHIIPLSHQPTFVGNNKNKHYTSYYNDETRQVVAEKYAQDIEYFGYKFGQ